MQEKLSIKKSQLRFKWTIWMPTTVSEVFCPSPNAGETLGETEDVLDRLCLSAELGTPLNPP